MFESKGGFPSRHIKRLTFHNIFIHSKTSAMVALEKMSMALLRRDTMDNGNGFSGDDRWDHDNDNDYPWGYSDVRSHRHHLVSKELTLQ